MSDNDWETLIESGFIEPIDREFSEFCKSRLSGLALTMEDDELKIYREAREKGEEILRRPPEDAS